MIKKIVSLFLFLIVLFIPSAMAMASYFDNPTPYCGETDVEITGKGVQTCIDVFVPGDCYVNLTFYWLNWSYGWQTYGSFTYQNATDRFCVWNDNVTCYIDGDFRTEFRWLVIANYCCPQQNYSFTTAFICDFRAEPCPLFYIYPEWNSTNVCPCCDAMCAGITNEDGHPMNITFYGHEEGDNYWYVWNKYTNITNGTYCYCMDTIQPTVKSQGVMHSTANHNVTIVDIWHNITYNYGYVTGDAFKANPATGAGVILEHGHYTITYWVVVQDADANPTGHKMAVRIYQNNSFELSGSYREVVFSKQSADRHLMSQVHEELFPGTTIRFQFIGDDTDQAVKTSGTWSTENINFYAHIEKTDMEEHHPLQFNTTYNWYVNVTDTVTGDYEVSDIFSFTTAENISDCPCGEEAMEGKNIVFIKKDIVWFFLLLAMIILGLVAYKKKNKIIYK